MLDTRFAACGCALCAAGARSAIEINQFTDPEREPSITAGDYATYVQALLSAFEWPTSTLFYSFPDAPHYYGSGYGFGDEAEYFEALPFDMRNAADFALSSVFGGEAQAQFSVSGFTSLDVEWTSDHSESTHIRIAQSSTPSGEDYGAWAYYPGTSREAGDVWFLSPLSNFAAGSWEWATMIHEIGHSLGLSHPHEDKREDTIMPLDMDGTEYTAMSYRTVTGGDLGLRAEAWGYGQSWMMLDIAALQAMYGADFTPNEGEVVYSWTPDSGNTYVNGEVAIEPGANRIFATIWDGGGNVTFDLSAYSTGVQIDMRPGKSSIFSQEQLAFLGSSQYASGNIYNGLLYNDDPRSLINKVIGSSGDDFIVSNDADNTIYSGDGDDTIILYGGNNTVYSGSGNNTVVINGSGENFVWSSSGDDLFQFANNSAAGIIKFGAENGHDTISGFSLSANHFIDVSGLFDNTDQFFDALSSGESGISILEIAPDQTITIDVPLEDLQAYSPSNWLILPENDQPDSDDPDVTLVELINDYYRGILRDDAYPAEIEWAVNEIESGRMRLEELRAELIDAPWTQEYVKPILLTYEAIYGRVPDSGGLDFWVHQYRDAHHLNDPSNPQMKEGLIDILKPFVDPTQAPEFVSNYGANPSAGEFVAAAYANVLNRAPDEGGLNFWTQRYIDIEGDVAGANPGMLPAHVAVETRAIVLEQFVSSPEYEAATADAVNAFLHGAALGDPSVYSGSLWDLGAQTAMMDSDNLLVFDAISTGDLAAEDIIDVAEMASSTATDYDSEGLSETHRILKVLGLDEENASTELIMGV